MSSVGDPGEQFDRIVAWVDAEIAGGAIGHDLTPALAEPAAVPVLSEIDLRDQVLAGIRVADTLAAASPTDLAEQRMVVHLNLQRMLDERCNPDSLVARCEHLVTSLITEVITSGSVEALAAAATAEVSDLPFGHSAEDIALQLNTLARVSGVCSAYDWLARGCGNDFVLVPVRLPAGTLSKIESLVVENSFGWSLLVDSTETVDGAGSPWHLFKLSADARGIGAEPMDGLVLAPSTVGELDSGPLEDILLARDDVAAMAWAIEKVVPGAAGRPLDRSLTAAVRNRRDALAAPIPPAQTGVVALPTGHRSAGEPVPTAPSADRSTCDRFPAWTESTCGRTRRPGRSARSSGTARRSASRRKNCTGLAYGSGVPFGASGGPTARCTSGLPARRARAAAKTAAGCVSMMGRLGRRDVHAFLHCIGSALVCGASTKRRLAIVG